MAFVVAVSGISGAGKTSIVERVAELVDDASELRFDDYASVSTYPADLKAWLEGGADLEEWKTPQLASDLRRLRCGERVELPEDRRIVEPAELILVEEPFGRLRSEMAGLIDLAAYLDLPADVLLARRLLRRLEAMRSHGEELVDRLRQDLNDHLRIGRELDAQGHAAIRESADVVLDGTKTVDEISATLVAEIHRRRPPKE